MKHTCVLFDVYGTLVVKAPAMSQRIHQALCALQVPHSMENVKRIIACREMQIGLHAQKSGFGMDDDRFLAHLLAADFSRLYPQKIELLTFARMLEETGEERYSLMPGAWNTRFRLRERGCKLGMVCNGTAAVRRVLEELLISEWMDGVVISDEAGVQKPDPAIIHLACERCGTAPGETIYVGDHPFDVLCAHDAGAKAAWMPSNPYFELPQGAPGPEYRLQQLSDLLERV